jgi:hypothetical protein
MAEVLIEANDLLEQSNSEVKLVTVDVQNALNLRQRYDVNKIPELVFFIDSMRFPFTGDYSTSASLVQWLTDVKNIDFIAKVSSKEDIDNFATDSELLVNKLTNHR